MADFVVAAVIAVVGLWVVVHEEMAARGLLPFQKKNGVIGQKEWMGL
ncbi:MAG TPA: hypothetical protein GX406_03375 [Pseudoclavibacter sp.]|nr:hypothetical protein [Pseudoclavibacter sp.]